MVTNGGLGQVVTVWAIFFLSDDRLAQKWIWEQYVFCK